MRGAMVNEHYAYHSSVIASNGNTHLHSVSTGVINPTETTLVQIDPEPVASGKALFGNSTMGQITVDNQRRLLSFRKFPIKSILKNGKVHNSSGDSKLAAKPRTGILKKALDQNGGLVEVPTTKSALPAKPPQVSDHSAVSNVSAKSATSLVQFRIENTKTIAASNEQSVSI